VDDQTFDRQTALDWIHAIEARQEIRDQDVILQNWANRILPKQILEIGCGQGISSSRIDLSNTKYTGVEPSPYLIQRARELYLANNRIFYQGSAYALPVASNAFDAAFSILVWHLLSDIEAASKELSRVLESNGNFLIITANPDGYDGWRALYPEPVITGKRLEGTMQLNGRPSKDVLYLHSFDEIRELLELQGLKIETAEPFRKSSFEGQHYLIAIQGKKIR
jgi:SAM-dependent methyltransferase